MIFSAASSFLAFYYIRLVVWGYEKEHFSFLLTAQSEKISLIFEEARYVVKNIAEDVDVVNYLRSSVRDKQDPNILEKFNLLNLGGRFSSIYLLNSNGIGQVSLDPAFIGQDYSFREYFKNSIAGSPWTQMAIGVTSKKSGYYFSYPVKSNGAVIGVLVGKLDPESIVDVINFKQIAPETNIMLSDQDGIVIYSNDNKRVFKSLGSLSAEKIKNIKNSKTFEGVEIAPLTYDVVQQKLGALTSEEIMNFYDLYDGEDEIIGVVPILSGSYYLIFEESLGRFLALALDRSLFVAGFIILFGFFIILMIYLHIGRVLKPLEVLNKGTATVAGGDLNYRINIKTSNELEDLANSFNKMVDSVRASKEEIEAKVKERTRELESMNKFMVGRELKMAELKKENEDLKKRVY